MTEIAVVIVAGGESTRFPGKLETPIDGVPLLLRTYRRWHGVFPVYICARGIFTPQTERELACPVIVDRWPRCGPLGALVGASDEIAAASLFAVAGDAPSVDRTVLDELCAARREGDEAVVPECDGRLEPLAALYDRNAVRREGFALLRDGERAMHALLARLRTRRVALPASYFLNINTPADLRRMTRKEFSKP